MGIVFCPYSQEDIIDSFARFRYRHEFRPATAASGENVWLFHVDVVEVEIAILGPGLVGHRSLTAKVIPNQFHLTALG